MNASPDVLAHLYHWPSSRQRIESFIRVLALPKGSAGKLHYDKKWIDQGFLDNIQTINQSSESRAIFWALSCRQKLRSHNVTNLFHFAIPVRLLTNLHVDNTDGEIYINYVAREFIADIRAVNSINELAVYADVSFGKRAIASPGQPGGFVFLGPSLNPETSDSLSLERLHNALSDLSYPRGYSEKNRLADYPLIRIDRIDLAQPNEQGSFELFTNQDYKVDVSIFQSDQNRDRSVYVNGEELVGKVDTEAVSVDQVFSAKDKLDVKIECENLRFKIPLSVVSQKPWYLWKSSALIFIACICISAYFLFKGVPSSENALLFSLIVVFIERLWDTITK